MHEYHVTYKISENLRSTYLTFRAPNVTEAEQMFKRMFPELIFISII